MKATVVPSSQPTLDDVLTLAEIKAFARIDHSDEDDLLTALRDAAARWIEDHCNTSIGDRDGYVYIDHFYTCSIPRGPINTLTQVEYLNPAGSWTVLDPGSYWFDIQSERARITFDDLPDVQTEAYNRVRISINYGHPEADVPKPLVQALRMLTLSLYENRQEGLTHGAPRTMPYGVYALTNPYRIG